MTAREYDYTEAAELLGVSEGWLKEHTPRSLPHRKFSVSGKGPGRVRFSDAHLAEIRAMFEVRPAERPTNPELRPVSRRRAS